MKQLILAFLFISTNSFAQMSKQDSIWLPMKYFIGEWKGTGENELGKGDYERTYQ